MKIHRLDFSSYLLHSFAQMEREQLQNFKFIDYPEGADILITNSQSALKNLNFKGVKLVIHPNSGYDNFPINLVKSLQAPIVLGNEIRAWPVAQYILSALISQFADTPQKTWNRNIARKKLLANQEVLIIGLGKIGHLVKNTLRSIVKKIHCYDPYVEDCLPTMDKIPLDRCSIVILTASLNQTNHQMIDREFLESLPPQGTLINAARGGLISQKDLLDFLDDHPNFCAHLDVFEQEPENFQKIVRPNLLVTSHIAGVFDGLEKAIVNFEKKIIEDFIKYPKEFPQKYASCILQNRIRGNILI
jgi:D-3-phosphoglycerate dehydrogenase